MSFEWGFQLKISLEIRFPVGIIPEDSKSPFIFTNPQIIRTGGPNKNSCEIKKIKTTATIPTATDETVPIPEMVPATVSTIPERKLTLRTPPSLS